MRRFSNILVPTQAVIVGALAMPEKSAEFFYGLEKNGVIELKKK